MPFLVVVVGVTVLVFVAMFEAMPAQFQSGYVLAYPDGSAVPYDGRALFEDDRLYSLFNCTPEDHRADFEALGLIPPRPDWSKASATGVSDWF